MAGNLSEEHRRWIIKTYWKYENAETVRRMWENEFRLPAPSLLTIYCIRDKFETTSSVANAPKSGRPKTVRINNSRSSHIPVGKSNIKKELEINKNSTSPGDVSFKIKKLNMNIPQKRTISMLSEEATSSTEDEPTENLVTCPVCFEEHNCTGRRPLREPLFPECQNTLCRGTHLGCSSLMEKGGDEDLLSGSKRARISSVYEKVNKFLKAEEGGRKIFKKGSPLTNEEIKSVVDRLGRTSDMFNIDSIDKEYKEFLNIYGCIYGGSFDIYGPSECDSASGDKIQHMLSIQKGFKHRCRLNEMKAEKVKSCWVVGSIDQGDEYYINLSGKKKENIYSMSYGESIYFAKDFLEFLDKFFDAYERKSEEGFYQVETYQEEGIEGYDSD